MSERRDPGKKRWRMTKGFLDVESHYAAEATVQKRALAGLSKGGKQTFNIGQPHTSIFARIGVFSSTPNTKSP